MSDLKEMTPTQLRGLIAEAKARLVELEPPGKRWFIQMSRMREVMEIRAIVVEAQDADAARAAALASAEDLSNEPDAWDCADDEATSLDVDIVEEEVDQGPYYRIGDDGKLENVG
jgi:hypothetical protein